jgi:hypothetical protein
MLVKKNLILATLQKLADERFGDMVKCVVDVDRNIMVAGISLYAD